MKGLGPYVFPALLLALGAILLAVGLKGDMGPWVMTGALLALFSGSLALLLQMGIIGRKAGLGIGLLCVVLALLLSFRNYRSMTEAEGPSETGEILPAR